jgi:Spy/CpxP family protein refolding chaperone
MKTAIRMKTCMMIVSFLIASVLTSSAQEQSKKWDKKTGHETFMNIPGLTDDQTAKIKQLKIEQLKAVKPLKNQLTENHAHYKTLMSANVADMKAINANIEECGKIRIEIMKLRSRHIQDIRSILTDEQKLYFDEKGEMLQHHHKKMKKGGQDDQRG